MEYDQLCELVSGMKLNDNNNKNQILKKINNQKNLTEICILARNYLSPQSTDLETICKKYLKIDSPIDETSGDGHKNGKNYEIKISIHAKKSKLNFVQIRPDHNIDFYIFIGYNMYDNNDKKIGKAYIFKIPSNIVYELIVLYGGYAHGTIKKLGEITINNIKGRNCEYALRCNPNQKKGKDFDLWKEFKKYKVDYNFNNF